MTLRSDFVPTSVRPHSFCFPRGFLLCWFGAAVVLCGSARTALSETIYWSDWGAHKIQAAETDQSNLHDVITGWSPRGIAPDLTAQKIFWADSNGIFARTWMARTYMALVR